MTARAIHPGWGLAEIAGLFALFEAVLWGLGPWVSTPGGAPAAVALYWLAAGLGGGFILWLSPVVLHRDPPSARGWGPGRSRDDPGALANAWPSYLALTLACAALLAVAAAIRDPEALSHIRWRALATKLTLYLIFAPIQALAFFGWLQPRLREAITPLLGAGGAARAAIAALTAVLFGLAHAPNWPFAALAAAGGLVWSWLYQARPNLVLVGVSHAVLGTMVHSVLGLYTRIGPFYAHPQGHILRNVAPGLRALIGNLY